MKKRLNYIDGLKGWCAVSICVSHFLLMFANYGFVGWNCMPEAAADPVGHYFKYYPYSIFPNNGFPLYIFFAVISFLITYLFLKNPDENKLKQKIIMRYFRFLPLIVIACVIAHLLLICGLCPIQEFFDITGNVWARACVIFDYSFFDVLKMSFFTGYFEGIQLVSPLWCLHYVFLGSMLTYFTMMIYNKIKHKTAFFAFLLVLLFFVDKIYLVFAIGMIAAIIANKEYPLKKRTGALLIFVGCLFGFFPIVLAPKFITIETFYAIGTGFVLVGLHCCFNEARFFNNKFMEFLGKESFSAIIFQFLVLQSLNIALYSYLYKMGMDTTLNLAINFVVNMGLSLFLTWVASKTITPLTNYVCKKVNNLLCKE